ncbi:hypothetical protein HMPREF1549_03069 [Actinomyces johnsonii F0510]|uniref:Uncharacterized protein n=1 Tax=Actinomyces johnsonii F0510 TaxID=1227262 RepID=U1PGM3_9ACTO|nr:hypothetical protein HMPREF1549_03069 [Actinomyces johnsonii F0510]
MASVRVSETSTEFHAEASLPRSAVAAQNVDRKLLLASCPRLQASECLCAVEEGNWGGVSAQKSFNAHNFWCVLMLWLGGLQGQ